MSDPKPLESALPLQFAEVIELLEMATGPDTDIDALIWLRIPKTVTNDPTPSYTGSVDAALTLVPEGWLLGLQQYPKDDVFAPGVTEVALGLEGLARGSHSNPAIALCIAALKARGVSQ